MYFEKLFLNFEATVMTCLDEFSFVQVHDKNAKLATNEYYFQHTEKLGISLASINSDPFPIIQKIFNINNILKNELENTSFLMSDLLYCNNTLTDQTNSQLNVGFGTNLKKEDFIIITLSKFNLMIHMTKERGTVFKDTSGIISVDNFIDNDDDINLCIHNSIIRYKQAVLDLTCAPFGSNFDDQFVKLIKALTFEELVNNKINSEHFKCHSKNVITSILDEEEKKYPKNSFEIVQNKVYFTMKDTRFLLKAIRPMLSSVSYDNFLKATNFFDNYQKLMNTNDGIAIYFHNKHKLKEINGAIFSFCFGDTVYVNVNIPDPEKNKDLFEIYNMNNAYSPYNIVQCSDLSKLFDYLFEQYAYKLSDILSKPVNEMDMNDASVLIMANF